MAVSKFDKAIKAIKNDKWKAFIISYIELSNATKAYMQAYKVKNTTTAGTNGNKLLKNAQIYKVIQAFYEDLWSNRKDKVGDLFNNLLDKANADIADIIEFKNGKLTIRDLSKIKTKTISSISQNKTVNQFGENVNTTVKMHDATKAIEMTAKVLEMMSDKTELDIDITVVPAVRPKKKEEKK